MMATTPRVAPQKVSELFDNSGKLRGPPERAVSNVPGFAFICSFNSMLRRDVDHSDQVETTGEDV